MDANALNLISGYLLEGAGDTLQAMLGAAVRLASQEELEIADRDLEALCEEMPLALAATLANNVGGVALLLPQAAALQLAALLQDQPSSGASSIGEIERALLKDLAEAVLGGAVAHLLEKLGQEFGQLQEIRVLEGPEAVRALPEFLKSGPALTRLQIEDNETIAGPAGLLFSQSFEDLVPAPRPAQDPQALVSSLLTEEEMQDILGGFAIPMQEMPPPAPSPAPAEYGENLDVVLDISLTAVARLGGLEMPIGEILTLGPGAIIEVGHLVDEPVELLVNEKLIARGEVVVVDEKFGLRITEIISPRMRIESLR